MDDLPAELIKSIQQKLAYILDPQSEEFDASFVQATALNPQLVVLLDELQLNSAKSQIEKEVNLCNQPAIHFTFQLSDQLRNVEETMTKKSAKPNGLDSILAAVAERKSMASKHNRNNID